MLSPSMHYGNRLETRRPTLPSRSPLPTRSTNILKLNETQHFHYDYVELGPVNVELLTGESQLMNESNFDPSRFLWEFLIESNDRKWTIRRTFHEFMEFDCQLHRCVFDRRHSRLIELRQLSLASGSSNNTAFTTNSAQYSASTQKTTSTLCTISPQNTVTPTTSSTMIVNSCSNESPPSPCSSSTSTNATTTTAALSWAVNNPINIRCHLATYVDRLSQLTGSLITCFPVLKFLELDSRGNHFVPIEQSQINVPAVAAAIVIQNFEASKPHELSIKVGDIISVIEMKSMEQSENVFWKGKLTISQSNHSTVGSRSSLPLLEESTSAPKRHFNMGYFPSSCVKLFSGKDEADGYYSSFSRSFRNRSFINRKRMWKIRPKILRPSFWTTPRKNHKTVFGVDLSEHLAKTNTEIPLVLAKCIPVIESRGLITGIYRQCGIQSNITRLRYEFDQGNSPDLNDVKILRDIHCVSSLLKSYFRQLPNPLFTYELYAEVLAAYESEPQDRITNIRKAVRRLPPAHFRTARALMYHLSRMSLYKNMTDMNASNLSIVWAPNLFRVPTTDEDPGGELLRGITIHKSLCNFFIVYAHLIFSAEDVDPRGADSFQDADFTAEMNMYAKLKEDILKGGRVCSSQPYIDLNGGPANLPTFHSVIERPLNKDDSPRWKKLLRYSSLENTITGFFHKRRRSAAKTSVASQHTLVDLPMDVSVTSESGNMRRSSSMFSNVTKNMEEIGQNMIRHVRNLSLRRSRRERRSYVAVNDMQTSIESTSVGADEENPIIKPLNDLGCDDNGNQIQGHDLRMTQSMEGAAMFNESESNDSIILDNKQLILVSNPEGNKIFNKDVDVKQKRVMFESSSRAEQIFYAVDYPTDENLDEDDKYSTDISSAESLPLDVSRYDNVVPQKK